MRTCLICGKPLNLVAGQFCSQHLRFDLLWTLVDRGIRSDWPKEVQYGASHVEMQISPVWTLASGGPAGTYIWQAELASILAWKGVRLDG